MQSGEVQYFRWWTHDAKKQLSAACATRREHAVEVTVHDQTSYVILYRAWCGMCNKSEIITMALERDCECKRKPRKEKEKEKEKCQNE